MSTTSTTGRRVLLGLQVLFNLLLPWALYRLSVPQVGETRAIIIAAVAPGVWSLVQFARSRQVDAWSVLVLSGIGLSLVILALGGSPKILLFRESLITGLVGLVFIGSAMIRRPLFYAVLMPALRAFTSPQSTLTAVVPSMILARARAQWGALADKPWFRRVMTVMTVAAGAIFVAETAVLSILVFSLPTDRFLLVRPLVRYGAAGSVLLVTFFYFVPAVRRGESDDEAEDEVAEVVVRDSTE